MSRIITLDFAIIFSSCLSYSFAGGIRVALFVHWTQLLSFTLRRGGCCRPQKMRSIFPLYTAHLRGKESSTTASRRSPFFRKKVQPTAAIKFFCKLKILLSKRLLRGGAAIVFRVNAEILRKTALPFWRAATTAPTGNIGKSALKPREYSRVPLLSPKGYACRYNCFMLSFYLRPFLRLNVAYSKNHFFSLLHVSTQDYQSFQTPE